MLRPILTRIVLMLTLVTFVGICTAASFVIMLSNVRFEYVKQSWWIVFLIANVLMAIHSYYGYSLLGPAREVDDNVGLGKASPPEARRALESIFTFIQRSTKSTVLFWTVGAILVAIGIWFRHPIVFSDAVATVCGGVAAGLVLYVLYQQAVLASFREIVVQLLERAEISSVDDPFYERFRFPLRKQLLEAFGSLVMVALLFSVMYGYTQAIQTVAGTLYAQAQDQFDEMFEAAGSAAPDTAALLAAAKGRKPAKGSAFYVLTPEGAFAGESEFSAKLRDDEKALIEAAKSPGKLLSRKGDFYVWRPLQTGKLLAYFPAGVFDRGRTSRIFNLVFVMVFLLAAILSVTFFVARNITAPLTELRGSFVSLAEGDLTTHRALGDTSEAGELGLSLMATIAAIRTTVEHIQAAHGRLTRAAGRVGGSAGELGAVSTEQAKKLDATLASLFQTQHAVQEVSDGTESLHRASQEAVRESEELERSATEMRESAAEVSDAVGNTNASIFEMAASIRNVSDNMAALRESGAETAQSIQELALSIQQVEAEALETSALSRQAVTDAEAGAQAVNATLTGVADIRAASEEAARTISALGEQMREIGGVLNVIEEVAGQTHLLSLNAAIIAAQAGEHGQGFAVVAEEIKKLAVRTAQSTKEIAALLGRIQEQARRGVDKVLAGQEAVGRGITLSEQARTALGQIGKSARATTERMNRIANATAEQGTSVRLITGSVDKMVGSVEVVTRAAEEQQHGADQIAQASESLRAVAERVDVAARRQGESANTIQRSMARIATEVQRALDLARQQLAQIDQAGKSATETGELAQRNLKLTDQLKEVVVDLNQESDSLTQALRKFRV